MTDIRTTRTDEELVRASLAGSHESFRLLVRRYERLVFGLCRHMLGCTEDALDASQDSFIASYRRLGELRQQTDYRAWLRRIAANECRQRLRARRPTSALVEDSALIEPHADVDESIDLGSALAGLSSDTRLTVMLFYYEGNSVRDIATFLGVPETAVMSRLRNARLRLRQDLQTMFQEPTLKSLLPCDFADRIPIPYDEYRPHPQPISYQPLSTWRREWLLSMFPAGSSISSSQVLGYDWEALPDRAVEVQVRTPDDLVQAVVLRMSGRRNGTQTEAALLPVLASLGLPVPRVVAGPVVDPDFSDRGLLMATTQPVGQSALAWAVEGGTKAIDHACDVVIHGIERIKAVTSGVAASAIFAQLERCSLADELARVVEVGGPWMEDERFSHAVKLFEPVAAAIDVPLVFSDSGIGPNARVDEDGNLIGFETFAWARVEDPHYQISKYWTYDCWPIRRAGFVERYLVRQGLSMRDFAPRLGVRALVTLQREIPLRGGSEEYRDDMLGWLRLAVESL